MQRRKLPVLPCEHRWAERRDSLRACTHQPGQTTCRAPLLTGTPRGRPQACTQRYAGVKCLPFVYGSKETSRLPSDSALVGLLCRGTASRALAAEAAWWAAPAAAAAQTGAASVRDSAYWERVFSPQQPVLDQLFAAHDRAHAIVCSPWLSLWSYSNGGT